MKAVPFFRHSVPDATLSALQDELLLAQGELSLAYRQFDLATEPELVESCVYQINAAKARCNYLIRAIKERSPQPALRRAGEKQGQPEEAATWT